MVGCLVKLVFIFCLWFYSFSGNLVFFVEKCRMAPTPHSRAAVQLCVISLILHSILTLIWLMNFVLENWKEQSHLISSKISVLFCESYTIMGGITDHIWSHYEESYLGIFSLCLWHRLVEIPGCIVVGLLGLIVDTPIISLVALAKSPLMLLKGWRQLILDLVGQPSSCVACVPFAGLAIVLWPLVVCATVLSAIFCSPFLGLFGAVIVYQVGNHSLPITPHPSLLTHHSSPITPHPSLLTHQCPQTF